MQRDVVDDGEAWTTYDRQCDAGPESQIAAVLLALAPVWYRRLASQNSHVVTAQAVDARRMGRLLGLDLAAIEAEAVREIPEPKSWARLQANSLAEKRQAVNDVARQAIDGDGEEGEGTEVSEEAEAALGRTQRAFTTPIRVAEARFCRVLVLSEGSRTATCQRHQLSNSAV